MSDDEGPEEFERELTPAEKEALKKLGETARRIAGGPKINIPASYFKTADLGRDILEAHNERLRAIFSESAQLNAARFAQLSGLEKLRSQIAENQATVGRAFKDIGDLGLKNIDFGAGKAAALIAKRFTTQQSQVWESLRANVQRIGLSFFPANLRAIDGIETIGMAKVREVVVDEGIPLYMVPRPETAELLLKAEDPAARRSVLADRYSEIVEDCREAVEAVASEMVARDRAMVLKAVAALEDGHHDPAQALIGSIVESLVWDHFGKNAQTRARYTGGEQLPDAYNELGVHEFIALAPIWQAFQRYERKKNDPIPTTFSRHAIAHTVSEDQFTKVNAVQGLMLVSSLVVLRGEIGSIDQAA